MALPLALHGVFVKPDGRKIDVRVGEDLVQVTSYNPRVTYAAGEAVSLHLPPDGIPLLPGEAA